MAKELQIHITAESKDIIEALNKLNDASFASEKTISQLNKQLAKLSVQEQLGANVSEKKAKVVDLINNKLQKQEIAYGSVNGQLKAYEKTLKDLNAIYQYQAANGGDTKIIENTLKEIAATEEKISVIKKENQALEENAKKQIELAKVKKEALGKFQQSVSSASKLQEEHDVMVALGNEAGLLQEKYKYLEIQLRESIKSTGVSSEKTKKLADEMKNLSVQIQKANYTPFNVRIKNLLSSFVSAQAILWGVRSAFRLLSNTITDSMKAASAAEETWNLFVTTFNDVESTAINTSTAIASSMGLATSTAQKALGVFGDLALGYGQTDAAALKFAETLTKSTLDLISYKNLTGSYDEIFSAIASGIAGNVENFRKYGVVITQAEVKTRLQQKGLDKLAGSSLQFAQMQERMNIFIEKTANAQGDMIKTMESTENVTRRLSEATKEWKENFGEDWNKTLTPVKSAIADYIESINRAREAEKQWAEGRTNIAVYTSIDPEIRLADLKTRLYYDVTNEIANTKEALKRIMVEFQASAEELVTIYRGFDFPTNIDYLQDWLERQEDYYKKVNADQLAAEKAKVAAEELKNAYKNLGETLGQIDGFDVHNIFMPNNLDSELKKIIESIQTSNATDKYASPIDVALGLNSVEDNFKAKLEAIKKLYEETYNFFLLQDGILDNQEDSTLKTIASLYKTVNGQLDEHNAKIEAEKERLEAVQSAIQSITNAAESYQSKIADSNLASFISAQYAGKSESFISNETARANALASNFAIFDAQSKNATEEELAKLVENLNLANSAVNEYYDILQKQIELEEEAARLKDKQDKSNAYTNALISAKQWNATPFTPVFSTNAVAQEAGANLYSDLMAAIDQMVSEMEAANIEQAKIDEAVEEIRGPGLEYIRQIVENTEEEQKNAWKGETKDILMNGLGEVGNVINALSSASGLGGLVTIFADLAVQTEAFQRVASLLSDNVLPVLNAFLEPLLPLIEMVGDQLQMMTETVLAPMFPILKGIIKVAITTWTLINAVTGFVSDSIKAMVGKITVFITDWLNSWEFFGWRPFDINNDWAKEWAGIDVGGNFTDKFDRMNQYLADIDAMSMKIADNTDPSNSEALKIYQDLYKSGTLSATQYSGFIADLAGNKYDNVGVLTSGLSYQKKNGGTYVAKQNVSIQIDGSNLSEEQLVSAIQKALDTSTSPGGNTYAYGVA